jgi:RNA polymerase primary sigma factor
MGDDAFRQYMREVARYALLSGEQERELARRIATGDRAAFEQLVHANLRLVVSIAKRYPTTNLELLDLIQEGNIGLIQAARRFDPERGFRFSTYATFWIKRAISLTVAESSWPLRLPVRVVELIHRIRRVEDQLAQELERDPRRRRLRQCSLYRVRG